MIKCGKFEISEEVVFWIVIAIVSVVSMLS